MCCTPKRNASCTILKGVREQRTVAAEIPLATKHFAQLTVDELPPCAKEGAGFMSDTAFETVHEHPYTYLWGNLKKTTLDHTPYSVCVVPFERMRKEVAAEHSQEWDLDYKASREPAETQKKAWVNDEDNQQSLLDGFFDVLRPIESLVFLYAKKTPLTDESAAVLLGVARISDIPQGRDWAGSDQGKRQVFWDRVIPHTLRPDFIDGFLMPYTEILERCRAQDIDPSAYTAFVPDATGTDFQYRAGLVSSDSALAALRSLQQALGSAIGDLQLKGSWQQALQWLSERIKECWSDRGPCPGLRAALSAAGVSAASRAALQLHELAKGGDPWPLVEDCLDGKLASPALQRHFRGLLASRLQRRRSEEPARWQVIKLLSRFNITKHQAKAWLEKPDAECAVDDPYQLYLRTRRDKEPIPFHAVDRTIYGEKPRGGSDVGFSVDWQDPPTDEPRRIAAIAIECLERGAKEGHTWLPEKAIVQMVSKVVEDQVPLVQDGDLEILADILAGQVHKVGADGWQLDRLHTAETLIRDEIVRRLSNAPDAPAVDARVLIDATIGKKVQGERDEAARTEKARAIETIVRAAISTLDGPAGTGKTTAIKALVNIPKIGNVLCLAPTGKARVQIERGFQDAQQRPEIKTVHSFLLGLERWDTQTGHFDVSSDGKTSGKYGTIVIDEASMFDVEMLAAVLAACAPCDRIVLVGDPRQLPPIGPGRPFVDIVSYIRDANGPACQLETIMRSKAGEETPFEFARLFDLSRNSKDDELWRWPRQESVGNLHFRYWKDEDELRHLLTEWVRSNLTADRRPRRAHFRRLAGRHAVAGHGLPLFPDWLRAACRRLADPQPSAERRGRFG
ncbi:AAA family ATPase [Cupriavidus basilensis]